MTPQLTLDLASVLAFFVLGVLILLRMCAWVKRLDILIGARTYLSDLNESQLREDLDYTLYVLRESVLKGHRDTARQSLRRVKMLEYKLRELHNRRSIAACKEEPS